ncbi:MAG: photosynthetic reaction center cytochrome c subunit family protein [Acidobacteriota bacterium]
MIDGHRTRLVKLALLAAAFCALTMSSRAKVGAVPGGGAILFAQASAAEQKTAEQVYKNIQVLNGLPASELDGVMYFMSASLGVACNHCHTNQWDSDAKSAKLGTRRMILMTRNLNKENFSGNPAVTCYTCHRGQPHSVPLPPADLATSQPPEAEVSSPKPPTLLSSDEIIARYIRAIGGDAVIEKMKTRFLRGTETITDRTTAPVTMPIEIYQTSENKLLIIRSASVGSSLEGFNGGRGWTRDLRGLREMEAKELAGVRRSADFFRYLKIRETYPQMRVLGKEKVGGREAYVVGATSRDDSREKLYFDANTGLLIRKQVTFKTAFGGIPEVTGFDDYRDVGGVKLPFTITWSRAPFGSIQKFTEIRLNVIVDDARFEPGAR